MNLLDLLNDPNFALPLAAGLLSARRGQEGQAIGQGLLGGMQGRQQGLLAAQKLAQEKQQQELMGIQLQQARQGMEDENAYRTARSAAPNFAAPSAPNMAPTPENAAQLKTLSPYEQAVKMVEYLRAKNVPEKYLAPYVQQAEKFKPKFKADQQLIKMPDGSLGMVNIADDGSAQVVPYAPAEKMKEVNLGGSVGLTGEYTGKMGPQFATSMTPGQIASNKIDLARLAQSDRHFQISQDQGKVPSGYRPGPNGSLEFIPGGPADPRAGKPTDTERVAAGYFDRMANAEKLMQPLESSGGKPGFRESMLSGLGPMGETAANALPQIMGGRSPERQQYRQAQEDWVRAKLRKESGAVIADAEMDREIRTYFPQIGDDPKVVAQKAKARQVAMNAMRTGAGPVIQPNVDDLLKKYGAAR